MFLRHRDAFGRISYVDPSQAGHEHYLRPRDGRLARLRVQGTDNAYGYGQRSWARNGPPRSRVSTILHLAHWTYSSVLVEGTEERHYTADTVIPLVLKWIPSCLLLVLLAETSQLLVPQNLEGVFKNGGYYDPVQYRDWRYPKVSRNPKEGEHEASGDAKDGGEHEPLLEGDIEMRAIAPHNPSAFQMKDERIDEEFDDLPARHFRPRYLCFLKDGPRGPDTEYETWVVTDWIKQHGDYASADFVLISYTRNQFLISPEQKWRGKPEPDEATRAAYRQQSDTDRSMVLAYAMEAARTAGKRAFWVDFECIRDADNVARAHAQSDDVYRICDIVRAAHSLVVLVGPPHDTRPLGEAHRYEDYNPTSMDQWLREWGTRLWTLPEILLCSPERRVKLYAVGGPNPPEEVAKRNIAARSVWPDAKLVRQLVDHYEASIHLTPLELVSIALECFSWRQTDQLNRGDISYALMGLLRRRPAVDESDTGFEAFARLSLANDSDKLLERLICMQPTRRGAPWHKIRDAWGARLWDVEPRCQVAFLKRATLSRLLGKLLLRGVPAYLILGLALTIAGGVFLAQQQENGSGGRFAGDVSGLTSASSTGLLVTGLIFLVPSAIITLLVPVMLLNIYQGKFWSTQAHFLGLEGIPDDIGEIERILFGFNYGRLKWSIAGSTLSRNGRSKMDERVGLPPLRPDHLDKTAHDGDGDGETGPEKETVFTLIDTYAMTATAFRATRPPTAVLVCGHEGGMQRAILCSYDWQDGTFVREAVIRVKTMVLDRMFRIDRFRFALGQKTDDSGRRAVSAMETPYPDEGRRDRFWSLWKIDLALLPFMWVVYGTFLYKSAFAEPSGLSNVLYTVGFLLVQPLNYFLFGKLHMGRLLGATILVNSVIAIITGFIQNGPALIFLSTVFGITNGIITPAFVYLTGLWYEDAWGRMLRIVIWASGGPFASSLSDIVRGNIITIVWAAASILLSGYAFFALGTPEQAAWLWESQSSIFTSTSAGPRNGTSSLKISTLLKRAQTYLFILTFLLVRAFDSSTLITVNHGLPLVVLVFVFPLLLVLVLGVLFSQFRYAQLPIIIVILTLSFAGKIQLSLAVGYVQEARGDGLWFLSTLSSFSIYLTWALLLTNMVEPAAFLGTTYLAFTGGALGDIIVTAYRTSVFSSVSVDYNETPDSFVPGLTTANTVLYALALAVLLSWSVYRWWSERFDRGHQQVDEHPYDHAADDNRFQAALVPGQNQARMQNYYNSDFSYVSVQDPAQPMGTQAYGQHGYYQNYA